MKIYPATMNTPKEHPVHSRSANSHADSDSIHEEPANTRPAANNDRWSTNVRKGPSNTHPILANVRMGPTNFHPRPENLQTDAENIHPEPMHFPFRLMNSLPSLPPIGPTPVRIFCPSCGVGITSKIIHEPSSKTHLIACIACIICFPLLWVPYCIDECQNANHYCPHCAAYIGTYK